MMLVCLCCWGEPQHAGTPNCWHAGMLMHASMPACQHANDQHVSMMLTCWSMVTHQAGL